MGLLDLPLVRRTRRNHAIEHATIHILSASHPGVGLAGRADSKGFFVFGDVSAPAVRAAAEQALARLEGEPELAVHPFCGTNLIVAGVLGGVASLVALMSMSEDDRRGRPLSALPGLLLAGTLAAVAGRPLGTFVQKHVTTLPDASGLRVGGVSPIDVGSRRLHRVWIGDLNAQ